MRLSCVRSVVHHRLACGDGRAFGVRAYTASTTADMSVSIFVYTIPLKGRAFSVFAILAWMSFHGAFLSSSRSYRCGIRTEMLKTVSTAWWSDLCSVPYIEYLTVDPTSSSEARTRLIVVSYGPPCHIFVPRGRRLLRARSLIRSMIRSASPYLTRDTPSPP